MLAMFDVKPTGGAAGLVLSQIKREIDLRIKKERPEETMPKTAIEQTPVLAQDDYWEELVAKLPQRPDFPLKYELTTFSKATILNELERTLQEPVDVTAELASVGVRLQSGISGKPRTKVSAKKSNHSTPTKTDFEESPSKTDLPEVGHAELEEFWFTPNQAISEPQDEPDASLAASTHVHTPASREIEIWLENIRKNRELFSRTQPRQQPRPQQIFRNKSKWSSWLRFNRKPMMWILGIMLSGLAIWGLVGQQGIGARNNIVQNGNNAVANLEEAKHELENFNFIKAADSFALAYDDLNKASGTLNQLGVSFLSVFGNLPGLNKVKAANNIVEAGQSLSKAGENLALAFGTLYKTNLLSFLDFSASSGQVPVGGKASSPSISKLLGEFKDILKFADQNIDRAERLLADIDASIIPEDKQELFLDFKAKIPDFQTYIGEAIDYSDFLLKLVGSDGAKTYLVLLQNNSELRPTGGFPGSYALITFEGGALKKIFVDDIYRADAGLKQNIVPPIPLQHITPSWGARDANWFADFPLSARKVIELYQMGGGPHVDGVLTITPDVIGKIFEVIGPIELPAYDLTLDANNFLDIIQNEVEYEADRSAPKQILSDLQPEFFRRLAKQDKDGWLKIFKIISEAAEQKHILAYFENNDLQSAAIKNGLGGEIKKTDSDYLQVVFSNVKGSKTDFVTENSMNLEGNINDEGGVSHALKISRVHNGGDSKFGFYNRDNSAYIKVYVPGRSVLESIQGHSITDYKSLIGHEDFGFTKDPDLEQIESTTTKPFAGVDVFEESGKTVFGFWLITKPKQTKSVLLSYSTPVSASGGKYNLLWQKQSGVDDDQIGFSFKLPEDNSVKNLSSGLQVIGENLVLNSDLSIDREVDIEFK